VPENVGEPEASGPNRAAQHDRLQVHRGQRYAEFLLSYPRAEGKSRSRNHGPAGLEVLLDDVVYHSQRGQDQTPCDDRK
jgi:hypothetical protein